MRRKRVTNEIMLPHASSPLQFGFIVFAILSAVAFFLLSLQLGDCLFSVYFFFAHSTRDDEESCCSENVELRQKNNAMTFIIVNWLRSSFDSVLFDVNEEEDIEQN